MTATYKLNNAVNFTELNQRLVTAQDSDFLCELYCASRDDEVANSGMPPSMAKAFLQQQFALQQKHYYKVYDPSGFKVLEYQGKAVGRLYEYVNDKDIRLIDITLFREYRNLGIGRFLIAQLIQRAEQNHSRVSLHVHCCNPALRLYLQLGFKKVESKNGYFYMEYGN